MGRYSSIACNPGLLLTMIQACLEDSPYQIDLDEEEIDIVKTYVCWLYQLTPNVGSWLEDHNTAQVFAANLHDLGEEILDRTFSKYAELDLDSSQQTMWRDSQHTLSPDTRAFRKIFMEILSETPPDDLYCAGSD